jgi:hypothetical protein
MNTEAPKGPESGTLVDIEHIGSPHTAGWEGWPEHGTIAGLLDALSRWPLERLWDHSESPKFEPHPDRKPFRCPSLSSGGQVFSAKLGHTLYLDGPPCYPDHPTAVTYTGNFLTHSFAFRLNTDDRELIAKIDAAIATNLARDWSASSSTPKGHGQ